MTMWQPATQASLEHVMHLGVLSLPLVLAAFTLLLLSFSLIWVRISTVRKPKSEALAVDIQVSPNESQAVRQVSAFGMETASNGSLAPMHDTCSACRLSDVQHSSLVVRATTATPDTSHFQQLPMLLGTCKVPHDSPQSRPTTHERREQCTTQQQVMLQADTACMGQSVDSSGLISAAQLAGMMQCVDMRVRGQHQLHYQSRRRRVVAVKIPHVHVEEMPDLHMGPLMSELDAVLRPFGLSILSSSVRSGCLEVVAECYVGPGVGQAAGTEQQVANAVAHAVLACIPDRQPPASSNQAGAAPALVVQVDQATFADVGTGSHTGPLMLQAVDRRCLLDADDPQQPQPCIAYLCPRVALLSSQCSSGAASGAPVRHVLLLHVQGTSLVHGRLSSAVRFAATLHGQAVPCRIVAQHAQHRCASPAPPTGHDATTLELLIPDTLCGTLYVDVSCGPLLLSRTRVLILPAGTARAAEVCQELATLLPPFFVTQHSVAEEGVHPTWVSQSQLAVLEAQAEEVEGLLADLGTVMDWCAACEARYGAPATSGEGGTSHGVLDTSVAMAGLLRDHGAALGGAVAATAAALLAHFLRQGRCSLATLVHTALIDCGHANELGQLVADASPARLSLLHLAVLSRSWEMVCLAHAWAMQAATKAQAGGLPCPTITTTRTQPAASVWGVTCTHALTPLHLAAAIKDDGHLASHICGHWPDAAEVWRESSGPGLMSPAQVGRHYGVHLDDLVEAVCGGGLRSASVDAAAIDHSLAQAIWSGEEASLERTAPLPTTPATLAADPSGQFVPAPAANAPAPIASSAASAGALVTTPLRLLPRTFVGVWALLAQHASALRLPTRTAPSPQECAYLEYVSCATGPLTAIHLTLVPLQTLAIVVRNAYAATPLISSMSAVLWAMPYLAAACLYWARPSTFTAHREAVWLWCGWGRVAIKLLMAAGLVPAPVQQLRLFLEHYLDLLVEAVVMVVCEMCRLRAGATVLVAEVGAGALMYFYTLRLWPTLTACAARAVLWGAAVATTTALCEWRMRAAYVRHVVSRSNVRSKVE